MSLLRDGGKTNSRCSNSTGLDIIPFDEDQAYLVSSLVVQVNSIDLSLGGRACLALARFTSAIAVTADRVWKDLDLGMNIQLVR